MKCPSCGGEVPHVAIKCKHCGNALKKQAPPPAPAKPAPRPPKPDDPLKALAKEALAQTKAKQGPAKADAKAPPPKKKPPAGDPKAPAQAGAPAEGEDGEEIEVIPSKPVDPRRKLMINAGIGVAVILAALIGWRTDAAQAYITGWAATSAVKDLPFEDLDGEYLGAGAGKIRVPDGYTELQGMPAGTRGLTFTLPLELAFKGRREVAFTLVGKRMKYEDAVAHAKGLDPLAREFTATYGKNAFRTIRYKQPPEDGAVGKLRTTRFYQSRKEVETPFTVEFAYEDSEASRVIMDKLIDRILTSIVE